MNHEKAVGSRLVFRTRRALAKGMNQTTPGMLELDSALPSIDHWSLITGESYVYPGLKMKSTSCSARGSQSAVLLLLHYNNLLRLPDPPRPTDREKTGDR